LYQVVSHNITERFPFLSPTSNFNSCYSDFSFFLVWM